MTSPEWITCLRCSDTPHLWQYRAGTLCPRCTVLDLITEIADVELAHAIGSARALGHLTERQQAQLAARTFSDLAYRRSRMVVSTLMLAESAMRLGIEVDRYGRPLTARSHE